MKQITIILTSLSNTGGYNFWKNMFFMAFTGALITFCAGTAATAVGSAVYSTLSTEFDYVYRNQEEGYFKDHPEDDRKKNTVGNIMHRVHVHLSDKKSEN